MIVVDIETSGLYPEKHGIWQIGALDFLNPKNIFLEECRIDDEDEFTEEAAKVHGKTERELRDKTKQAQKQTLENFFDWVNKRRIRNALCQNPQFDVNFINIKAKKYNIRSYLPHRSFDLHTIAAIKHLEINNTYLIKENKSDMGLSNTMRFCGIGYERKSHNALEDAKLTAECFSRLVYGKALLEEFSQFKIPEYLLK